MDAVAASGHTYGFVDEVHPGVACGPGHHSTQRIVPYVRHEETDDNGFWQPDTTVATVVVRDGRLLVVEEDVRGRHVLNQPAGHLEPDESLHAAAVRETLEETGWQVELTAFVGAYQWTAPAQADGNTGCQYLRHVFAARTLCHRPEQPLDAGILRALWLSPEELLAERARHRSPLVWRAFEDYLGGQRLPLSAVAQVEP